MKCSLCNAPIDDSQNICPECKLYALMERENLYLQQKQEQNIKAIKKVRRRYLIFILCVLASVSLIIIGFYTISYKSTYNFSDGSSYSGEIRAFMFNGYGTYTYDDGRKYAGEWKNGERDGQGTETNEDGSRYTGEWKNGMRDGQGTEYDKDGKIRYSGEFHRDRFYE